MMTDHREHDHSEPRLQELPPALTMALSGLHLIEASAGTGKTWALSALIVRFLIERRLEPRQIIATTFTRAAAAELQERIRQRIHGIWTLLHESLTDVAQARERATLAHDLLGVYVLDRLSAAGRVEAYQHLKLALSTFDELFVGTLDSFCQKIWREFAFDIGGGEAREISEETDALTEELIHDAIRGWRSAQAPFLIEQLVLSGRITDIEHHAGVVATALNFLGAEIAPVAAAQLDGTALEEWQATATDLAWLDWLTAWSGLSASFYGGRKLAQHHMALPELVDWMKTATVADLLALDEDTSIAQLLSVFAEDKFSTNFKKDAFTSAQVQVLLASNVSDAVRAFVQIRQDLLAVLTQARRHLHYTIALHVRAQLPIRLAAQAETTFSTQMHGLADALWRDSGALLAEQIRYRYPVALVDEFQDTNRDQDRVIERIYRQPWCNPEQRAAVDMPCLVLVGDPKQAIYGFRGGDVHTYLAARAQVAAVGQIHALDQNQRSVVPLVQGVNAFFRQNAQLGDGVDYPEVSPADRGHAPLMDHGRENPYPLRFIQLTAKSDAHPASDEISQTVWHIMQLLQDSAAGQMSIDGRVLLPEDIAVLASSHRDLDAVEAGLREADIPVWRQSRVNVFQSVLSHDLAALLQLMLSPYREDALRRALTGRLIGEGLRALDQHSQDAGWLAEQQAAFAEDALVWQRYGFLSAWQRIAARYRVFERLSDATPGEAMLAERSLVNLRHLIELLHRQSERRMGPHHLLAWLLRQIASPSERGDEIERPLPSVSGVQLMTIHASKGLEFAIVFMIGLPERASQGNPKASETILYVQDQIRMMSFDEGDEAKRAQHVEREAGEERRLLYVAATRAKYRQYLYLKAPKKDTPSSFAHWLPEGVQALIDAMPGQVRVAEALKAAVDFRYRPIHASPEMALVARPSGQRYYAGWGMTSFSALIRDVGHGAGRPDQAGLAADMLLGESVPVADDGDASDEYEQMQDDAVDITGPNDTTLPVPFAAPATDLPDIRFRFERGANGGNCLHKILEYLDPRFDEARVAVWTETFARQMQHHGIQGVDPEEMVPWFRDIMQAPISGGTTLAGLRFQSRVREFEFHLSLGDETVDGPRLLDRLKEAGIIVPELPVTRAVRYLKGFADLVYEHDGRFYVADYKSNFLGDQRDDYHQAAMITSMAESGYWLQASVYLVALHRYLKSRKADYQIERHLGGACYLYLRGMRADAAQTGVVHWMPAPELILDLDAILGQGRGGSDAA